MNVPEGVFTAELCTRHSKPVYDFIDSMPDHLFVRIENPHPRARVTTFRISTMDEIERAKARWRAKHR